jgi:DNA-binding Lrp family transcriptional regulator
MLLLTAVNRLLSATTADRKQFIIDFIEKNGQDKINEFADALGLGSRRVRDLLREMVNNGTIEKVGDKRYTCYVLKQK